MMFVVVKDFSKTERMQEYFTAPGAGKVVAINRGDRRALVSVVIELNDNEKAGKPQESDFQTFESYKARS